MKPCVVLFALILTAAALSGQSPTAVPQPPAAPSSATPLLHLPATKEANAQKAQQLLEQMVTALGGQAYLTLDTLEQHGRTYGFSHGEPEGAGTLFRRTWKWPDKDRFDFNTNVGEVGILPGVDITSKASWANIYSGNSGLEITFRGAAPLEAPVLQDYLRRRDHSLPWVLRKWLKEPGIAVFYNGQGLAERKQVDQVSILNAQNDGVTISIDVDSHLPIRVAFTWRDPKTRDRTEEAEGYANYRLVQGIMTPLSITRYKNGDPTNQRFLSSTTYNQQVTDALFNAQAKPAAAK